MLYDSFAFSHRDLLVRLDVANGLDTSLLPADRYSTAASYIESTPVI